MRKFFQTHQRLISIIAPIFITIVFLCLSCLNLNSSIWFDEAFSSYLIRGNFADIWQLTALDVHPPFFYFCLKIWSLIFGTSVLALRFMSVFFGGLSLILIFHLVKQCFGLRPAVFATFFMSLSPVFIRLAQEMRMYTLVLFIVTSATFVLIKALQSKKRHYWIIYAILVSLGMWTHYFTSLAWLTHLIFIYKQHGSLKKLFRQKAAILSYLLSVLLYLPWLPFFLKQFNNVQRAFWIPSISLKTPIDFISDSLFLQSSEKITNWIAILAAATVAAIIFLTIKIWPKIATKQRFYAKFLAFLVALPPLLLLLLSLPPLRPMFVDRYASYSSILIWLTLGLIIFAAFEYKVSKLPLRIISLVFVLAVAGVGIFNVTTREPKGHVQDIFTAVTQDSGDNSPILAATEWIYYDAAAYSSTKHPVHYVSEWSKYQYGSLEPIRRYKYNLAEHYSDFLKSHDSFWYITETPKDQKPKLPAKTEGFLVTKQISNPHHTAIKLERNKNTP